MSTGIEWTDETWNPTTGCDQVSPGCDNCYALTMAKRLKAMGMAAYQADGDPRTSGPGFALQVHEDRLGQPLRWRKPRRVFVNSMSDLFHPKVPDVFIARVFAVMLMAPQHTFQVLTKRPKRMRALLSGGFASRVAFEAVEEFGAPLDLPAPWPLPNVWLGTSVEDQQRADERIPALLDTPAAVRFLSCEPLLGPVDLSGGLCTCDRGHPNGHQLACSQAWVPQLDWIIVGGESGPGARPMHPQWARDLRDQATDAGVAFFFKQWGAWAEAPPGTHPRAVVVDGMTDRSGLWMANVGKHAAGRHLDGRTWDQMPTEVTAHA